VRIDQVTSNVPAEYSDTGYALTTTLTTTSGMSTCKAVSSTAVACTVLFNAPVTTATQTDAFYLYAYSSSQTAGAVPTTYVPSGSLLAEDIGSGNGDPVPSAGGTANAGGIPAGESTSLTFNLLPVVAQPLPTIGGTSASASAPLVLSVPGTGGSSNVLDMDGLDAAGNNIATYLSGKGDNIFSNPIAVSAAPAQFSLSTSSVGLVNQPLAVTYTAATTDQPPAPTSTPLEGTLTAAASFFGGYLGTSSFPTQNQSVSIAPLYAVATALTGSGQTGYEIYAVQAAVPTGVTAPTSYTLSGTPNVVGTNECSGYTVSQSSITGNAIRAAFEAEDNVLESLGEPCTFVLSDSIVQVKITVAAPAI
jgi:hypothetical protein